MKNSEQTALPQQGKLICLPNNYRHPAPRLAACVANSMLARVPGVDAINRIYRQLVSRDDWQAPFHEILRLLEITYRVQADDLSRIPDHGPLVVVANHPFGGIEGILLGELLGRVRPDTKILGNYLLARVAPLNDRLIPVDPFGSRSATGANARAYRTCIRWLRSGGCLVVFPAGEVSHYHSTQGHITDPPWSDHVGSLIRMSGANVLPIYFPGRNSLLFNVLGMVHPRLRTLMLPRELIARRGSRVRFFIGRRIAWERMNRFNSDRDLIDWLRFRTFFLSNREKKLGHKHAFDRRPNRVNASPGALIPPVPASLLAAEVTALDPACILVKHKGMQVFITGSEPIPHLLREIGRLREKTFREASEGTGKAMDVDLFDSYYRHLVLWNNETAEVVGAYRIGDTRDILDKFGMQGLYTHSLFRFKPGMFRYLSDSLELGRSFIRAEYQRQPNCLFLLWKGIGAYLVKYPQYRRLFGPVSISNSYHRFSKAIMIHFLQNNCGMHELKAYVSPRCPFRVRPAINVNLPASSIDDISMLISEIEDDGKRVPILIKHYLKLNGQFIAFNVDHAFCDAVDGLVVVDLMRTDTRLLQRFLGKEGAWRFLAHWEKPTRNDRSHRQLNGL
jgi:putative hemolysin